MQDQQKIIESFRDDQYNSAGSGQFVSMSKYSELAAYME